MIKRLLFLLVVMTSSSAIAGIGVNNEFGIISQNDFSIWVSKGKDVVLTRLLVVPSIDKNYKDIFEVEDESAIFAKFCFMLKKNKAAWIEKFMNNSSEGLRISPLIKGLYYFSQNQYVQAIMHLEKVSGEEYQFLKLLLLSDCHYELLQNKKNYKSILAAYQLAMDCTDDEQSKLIVHNRIKFIKYH